MSMSTRSWGPSSRRLLTPESYIRDLPYSVCEALANELDPPGTATNWKDFVVKIPRGPDDPEPKYTALEIK